MISIAIISQLIGLALNTISQIQARRAARAALDQGQKIRAALAQTATSTKIYDEIVTEAKKQIAERNGAIAVNLVRLGELAKEITEAGLQPADVQALNVLLVELRAAAAAK